MQPNLNDKIQQAKAAGYSDTEIQSYLRGAGFQAPAPTGGLRVTGAAPAMAAPVTQATKRRAYGGTPTSLISEAGGLAGAALGATKGAAAGAAIGSVVPGAGTIIGSVLGGAIGGFAGGFLGRSLENKVRDDEYKVKEALGEGVTSGIAGGLGGAVRGVQGAKALKGVAEGSRLTKAGVQQQISALGIKGTGGPQTATETRRLLDVLKQVPGTNANAKLQNMPAVIARKNAEIADILSKSTLTTTKTALKQNAITKAKGLSQFLETDPSYKKALASELKELTSKFGTAKVTAAQVQTAKSSLGNKMTNIFSKIDRAVDLNPKEAARLAVWQSLDDSIIKLAPQAKQATLFLSNLRTASPAIYRASEKAFGVPLLGIKSRTAESALQTVRTLGGRAAEVAGRTTGRVPAGTIPALGAIGTAGIGRLLTQPQPTATLEDALMVSPTTTPELGMPADFGQSSMSATTQAAQPAAQNPFTPELLITAIASDPKNAALYERLYKLYEDRYKAPAAPKYTATQAKAAASAQNALQDIPMIADAIESGVIGGAKALPGSGTAIGQRFLGTADLDAALFNIADNILRARTGAAAPEAEIRRFMRSFLPNPLDTKAAQRSKLERAIRELQAFVNPPQNIATLEEALISQTGGAQ